MLAIRRFDAGNAAATASVVDALADLLIDAVDGGASIGFLPPLARAPALAYWRDVLDGVTRGERVLLCADDGGTLVGTASLALAGLPNGAHRADVQKVIVHRRARRLGVARRLMLEVEAAARASGRRLLVLDTEQGSAAESMYRGLGWVEVGAIPGYALVPGGTCATVVFYKQLA